MEFLNGELLYAMRVVSHGGFNLCPSESCNPEDGGSQCGLPLDPAIHPVEFYPYKGVPAGSGCKLAECRIIAGICRDMKKGLRYQIWSFLNSD